MPKIRKVSRFVGFIVGVNGFNREYDVVGRRGYGEEKKVKKMEVIGMWEKFKRFRSAIGW
ncbi:hypothetical protein HAX54_042189, partial [Datura stramonium]|nr:hypothetical protein [Datura stramonium]